MKKYFYFLFFIVLSIHTYAQSEHNNHTIKGDTLSKEELYSIHNSGWVHFEYQKKKYLLNFSNKNYILSFATNCKDKSQKPGFLIEYSNNYRDGNFGGIDFTSSNSNNFKKILFLIDDQEFENPFDNFDEDVFKNFKDALKNGKNLTIKFFNFTLNPETGKNQLDLNREITFLLENGNLLDEPIDCKD